MVVNVCVCGGGGGVGRQGAGLDVNGQKFQKRVCGERRGSKHTKTMTSGGALTPNRSTQIRNNTTINTCNMRRKSTGGRWGGGQGHSGSDTIGWKGSCDAAKTRGQRIRFAQRCKMQIRTKAFVSKIFPPFCPKTLTRIWQFELHPTTRRADSITEWRYDAN